MYKKWFQKIDVIFRELIWKAGPARISLRTLQLQRDEGGVALQHSWSYFMVAQLQYMGGSNMEGGPAGREILLQNTLYRSMVEAMEADSSPL